jgi:CBS domain-containing protein
MGTTHIAVAEAGPTVADVMLAKPDVFGPETTVADARREFESPRQKLVVIAAGGRYLGAADREALEEAEDDALVTELGASIPTLGPDEPTARIFEIVEGRGLTRIPVVDDRDCLLGLVCFNGGRDAFCVA